MLRIADWLAALDKRGIDWLIDGLARAVRAVSASGRLDRSDGWSTAWSIDLPPVPATWACGCGGFKPAICAST